MARTEREILSKATVAAPSRRVRVQVPAVEELFWMADRLLAKVVPWMLAGGLAYFAAHVLVALLRALL